MATARNITPSFAVQSLHVATLLSLGFTARLYAALGSKPMFFSLRQAAAADVLLFVVVLSALLPALAVGVLWLVGRLGKPTAAISYFSACGLLLAIIALPLCKQLAFLPEPAACALAVLLGIAATVLYGKFVRLRAILTILAPIVVLSPALYLFATPTSQLIFPRSAATAAGVHVGNPATVVMVVFDELSGTSLVDGAGRIDASLFPNFAALAQESTWFRNASSVAAETDAALPAILTGNLPQAGVHELDWHEYPDTLFSLLRGSHRFSVYEPCTDFCPAELRGQSVRGRSRPTFTRRFQSILIDAAVLDAILILPPHWPLALPDVSGKHCNLAGADSGDTSDPYACRREILEGFIDHIQAVADPQLLFIHSVLPHAPWLYLPSGKQYDLEGLPPEIRDCDQFTLGVAGLDRHSQRWLDEALIVAEAQNRYLLQVQFVDRELGRLIAHLKAVGLYDQCLIVVTADHGVSFVPGEPFRGINQAIYPETLSVPLLIKVPGQREGRTSNRNVEEVDILPSIADVLEIGLPWASRGSSALDDRLPQRPGKEACMTLQPWTTWKCDPRLSDKEQAVRRRLERFPFAGQPEGLFRFGPYADLVGRRVADCRVASELAGRWTLYRPERLAHVDLQQVCLPLLIGGTAPGSGNPRSPCDLAVAVNGTIRAVVRSFVVLDRGDRWTALLPEDALRQGANEIRLFRLSGSGAGVVLEPLEKEGSNVE